MKFIKKLINNKKILFTLTAVAFLAILIAGVTYAAFTDSGKVLGSTFTVGSADLKFVLDLAGSYDESNLVEDKPGPSFDNVGQNWEDYYPLILINQGSSRVSIISKADYQTANDPEELRQFIYAEVFQWDDLNSDRQFQEGELGQSFGKKTIIKWKTEGIDIGYLDKFQDFKLIVKFSTSNLSETKQGASGTFDFIFESVQDPVEE